MLIPFTVWTPNLARTPYTHGGNAIFVDQLIRTIQLVGQSVLSGCNVHILLDFGFNSLYEGMNGEEQREAGNTFNAFKKQWKQETHGIPQRIMSHQSSTPDLKRWMETNLKIVHMGIKTANNGPDPHGTVTENETRTLFLHGDTDNTREFYWPYASFRDMRPRCILPTIHHDWDTCKHDHVTFLFCGSPYRKNLLFNGRQKQQQHF